MGIRSITVEGESVVLKYLSTTNPGLTVMGSISY